MEFDALQSKFMLVMQISQPLPSEVPTAETGRTISFLHREAMVRFNLVIRAYRFSCKGLNSDWNFSLTVLSTLVGYYSICIDSHNESRMLINVELWHSASVSSLGQTNQLYL